MHVSHGGGSGPLSPFLCQVGEAVDGKEVTRLYYGERARPFLMVTLPSASGRQAKVHHGGGGRLCARSSRSLSIKGSSRPSITPASASCRKAHPNRWMRSFGRWGSCRAATTWRRWRSCTGLQRRLQPSFRPSHCCSTSWPAVSFSTARCCHSGPGPVKWSSPWPILRTITRSAPLNLPPAGGWCGR